MAKQITDLNEMLGNFASGNDFLIVRDSNQKEDKKIKISELANILFLEQHNVGSVYITYSSDDDPNDRGGTWVLSSKGRSIVGYNESDTDFDGSGKYGGAKTHTLSIAEIPYHRHAIGHTNHSVGGFGSTGLPDWASTLHNNAWGSTTPDSTPSTGYPSSGGMGGGGAHNNMHPYVVAYIWKRTA